KVAMANLLVMQFSRPPSPFQDGKDGRNEKVSQFDRHFFMFFPITGRRPTGYTERRGTNQLLPQKRGNHDRNKSIPPQPKSFSARGIGKIQRSIYPDGSSILAADPDPLRVDALLCAAGYDPAEILVSRVALPEEVSWSGLV